MAVERLEKGAQVKTSREDIIIKLLLAPIEAVRKDGPAISVEEVANYGKLQPYPCIVSSQAYVSGRQNPKAYRTDPDMSDFAVGFYECIYKAVLEEADLKDSRILNPNGNLANKCFAGDTMNSFNRPANALGTIGKSRRERSKDGAHADRSKWPDYVKTYLLRYHCLANFWLLPADLGRNQSKPGWDYMHRFLGRIVNEFKAPKDTEKAFHMKYKEYFDQLESLNRFIDIHAIECYFDGLRQNVQKLDGNTAKSRSEAFFKSHALGMMRERAKLLAKEYREELWEYFDSLNLTGKVSLLNDFPALPLEDQTV